MVEVRTSIGRSTFFELAEIVPTWTRQQTSAGSGIEPAGDWEISRTRELSASSRAAATGSDGTDGGVARLGLCASASEQQAAPEADLAEIGQLCRFRPHLFCAPHMPNSES